MTITVTQALSLIKTRFNENEKIIYNLMYLIAENNGEFITSVDGTFLIAQADENFPLWIWTADNISDDTLSEALDILDEKAKGKNALKINTASEVIITHFTGSYTERMNAYVYRQKAAISSAKGAFFKASMSVIEEAAALLAEMEHDAGNSVISQEQALAVTEELIKSAALYLWRDKGKIVSMAAIVHKTEKYARIGRVFTPARYRRNGYCSALVGTLAHDVLDNGKTPALYTQADNIASNKAYNNAGFSLCGGVKQIVLTKREEGL